MGKLSIPTLLEDFNAAWFSAALEREVQSIDILSKHFSSTGHVRIALHGDPSLPKTVFLKLPPEDEMQRKFVNALGMGVREARFYRELAKEMPVRVPQTIYANYYNDDYVMVLEDLIASGCRFSAAKDKDIVERTYGLIEEMPKFHGKFWQSARFTNDLAWIATKGTASEDGGVNYIQMAYDKLRKDLSQDFTELAEFYMANAPQIIKLLNQGPRTLNQGDCSIKNMFVDVNDNNRAGFLDWGVINASPGIIDVSYLIVNALPENARIEHEKELIKLYCKKLFELGIDYDFEEAWRRYQISIIYHWVAATATAAVGSKWLPLELSMNATQRSTNACKQLKTKEIISTLIK